MVYLTDFSFVSVQREERFLNDLKRTCYQSVYPFMILTKHEFTDVEFAPVTIFYGGNGSGKTTALNVIAEKLGLKRDTLYNRSNFFGDYVRLCDYDRAGSLPPESRIITSDDVFDFMLNIRTLNEGIDRRREDLFEDYMDAKYNKFQMKTLEDYDQLVKVNQARSKTQSQYIRENLVENAREHSNGESAFLYFTEKIKEQGLYLLDEPENSLSPERQQELLAFIEENARFYGCQFIIATHSPFLLSMKGARIYDLDREPVQVRPWTELSNVRAYYEFFQSHQDEF